jgi:hypothetical protein
MYKQPKSHSGHRHRPLQERTQASAFTDEVVELAEWQTVLYFYRTASPGLDRRRKGLAVRSASERYFAHFYLLLA